MNISKNKTCKLCSHPAQMSLTMQVTTVGQKKRRRISAKAVPLCFGCGALWGVALSSGVAEPYCEAVNALEPSANASIDSSLKQSNLESVVAEYRLTRQLTTQRAREIVQKSSITVEAARRIVNIAAARSRWDKEREKKRELQKLKSFAKAEGLSI